MVLLGCGDDADPASPLLSTQKLEFGQTDCGTVQVPRSLLLANPSSEAFTFTTAFATGTHYMVQPSSGFVLPGQQIELTVFSASIPRSSATTADLADTLTITTDLQGDEPHSIAIEQTAHGASLSVSTSTVAIPGTHVVGTTTTASVTIKNVGNAPVSNISVASKGAFTFAPETIATLAPGEEVTGTVTYRASSSGLESAPITLTVDGEGLCGSVPAPIVASGTGTFAGAVPTKIVLVPGTRYRNAAMTMFALLPGGMVASLGSNDRGVRGAGSGLTLDGVLTTVRTDEDRPLDGVVDLTGNRGGACALRSNGSVYCWGNDSMARNKDQPPIQPFAKQVVASGATAVAMNYGVRCIATNPGGVVTCAANGTPATPSTWKPTDVKQVSLHTSGGYAIKSDGTVLSFGSNAHGERGNNSASNSAPSLVTGLTDVKQTIAHSGKPNNDERRGGCALKTDGTVWCWGSNRHGRLGNGSTADTAVPQQVMIDGETPLTGVTEISGAHGHRCAITPTNVYCWGNGRNGKLGRSAPDENSFAQATDEAITGAISVATTNRGTCVLQASGRIVCFGRTPISELESVAIDDFVAP